MRDDIESLNLAELDVEQLEQRIELGHLFVHPDSECVGNSCHVYDSTNNPCNLNTCTGFAGSD